MKLIELLSPVTEEQKAKVLIALTPLEEGEEVVGQLSQRLQNLWCNALLLVEEGISEQARLRVQAASPGASKKKLGIKHGWLKDRVDTAMDFFWRSVEEEFDLPGESLGIRSDWTIVFSGPFCPECQVHHDKDDSGNAGRALASLIFGDMSRG